MKCGLCFTHIHTLIEKESLTLCSILCLGQDCWRREQCVLGVKEGARETAASTSCYSEQEEEEEEEEEEEGMDGWMEKGEEEEGEI